MPSSSYKELLAQIAKLTDEAEAVREKELIAVIADIKEKIKEYGLTAKDLGFSGKGQAKPQEAVGAKAKFKGPNGELWSGRGRTPGWLSTALGKGLKKEEFQIK
ncbi:MAG TPA: H-NS histone family protein [Rhodocyclaceae bacterium]|nr:H-NS histone family protein [Rhodocyclaceae bacterium]